MELKDLQERELPELQKLLLIQAFDGRPFRVCWNPWPKEVPERNEDYCLIVEHEDGQHHVQLFLTAPDFEMLYRDIAVFRERFVEPIVQTLDGAAYPARTERLMPTFRRVAELMANGRTR